MVCDFHMTLILPYRIHMPYLIFFLFGRQSIFFCLAFKWHGPLTTLQEFIINSRLKNVTSWLCLGLFVECHDQLRSTSGRGLPVPVISCQLETLYRIVRCGSRGPDMYRMEVYSNFIRAILTWCGLAGQTSNNCCNYSMRTVMYVARTQSKMYGAMFNVVKEEALEETQRTCKLLKLYLVVIFAIS